MKDINFFPETKKQQIQIKKPKSTTIVKIVTISIICALILVVSLVAPRAYLILLDASVSSLQAKIDSDKYNEVKQLSDQIRTVSADIEKKTDIINTIDSKGYSVLEILNTIKQSAPKGCYIKSIDYFESTLKVDGYSDSKENNAQFLINVERLNYIKAIENLDSLSYQKFNNNGTMMYEFSYTFHLGK